MNMRVCVYILTCVYVFMYKVPECGYCFSYMGGVKGDVQKSVVAVVQACSGYEACDIFYALLYYFMNYMHCCLSFRVPHLLLLF